MHLITNTVAPVLFSELGMIVEGELSYEQWRETGEFLKDAEFRSSIFFVWAWADWLLYGEQKYGEMYTQAISLTGKSYGTLQNYKWLGNKTERYLRGLPGLAMRHYMDLATMKDKQLKFELLTKASARGWTAVRLKEEAGVEDTLPNPGPPTLEDKYQEAIESSHALEESLRDQRLQTQGLIEQLQEITDEPIETPEFEWRDLVTQIVTFYKEDRIAEMLEVIKELAEVW